MKSRLILSLLLLAFLLPVSSAFSQEGEDADANALSKLAERYVNAYNQKKITDMLSLFTEEAEMINEIDGLSASGIDQIREIFEKSFSRYPDRKISLETISVREIAKNLVIEEGVATFSGEVPNEEGESVSYSAILMNVGESGWKIASSRELRVEADDVAPLVELYPLLGYWMIQGEQMQMDYQVKLGPSDRSLLGHAVVTTPSEGATETEVRILYDAANKQLRMWTFDDLGGFSEGLWQKSNEGNWLITSSGVTAAGEQMTQTQELRFEDNENTILWNSTHRFLDGVPQPDLNLRMVRRPPAPTFPMDHPVAEKKSESAE